VRVPHDAPLHFRTQPARLPECVDDLAEDLERLRPRPVVIDTLSRIIPPDASLNDSGGMTRALDLAQQLAFAHDCARLLVHHQRKNNESADHLDWVMGAIGITGAADAIWTISRKRGEDHALLAVTGRDIEAELLLGLDWSREECRWLVREQTEYRPAPSLTDQIVAAVADLGSADATDVAARVGRDRSTVQAELKRLREAGALEALKPRGQRRRLLYSIPGGRTTGPPSDRRDGEPDDGRASRTELLAEMTRLTQEMMGEEADE
jgi:DNA-binding transcriptional ArsR family regulator